MALNWILVYSSSLCAYLHTLQTAVCGVQAASLSGMGHSTHTSTHHISYLHLSMKWICIWHQVVTVAITVKLVIVIVIKDGNFCQCPDVCCYGGITCVM